MLLKPVCLWRDKKSSHLEVWFNEGGERIAVDIGWEGKVILDLDFWGLCLSYLVHLSSLSTCKGRRSGAVAGHKQFTQQLLADLHLPLPKPLNQPQAPAQPCCLRPPCRHSLTSLKPQGLSSGGRFYSSALSDSSPQGIPGNIYSAAFTGRKCWAHAEILLTTAQSTRKWEVFVMRGLSWIREQQTSLNKRISQWSTAPVLYSNHVPWCSPILPIHIPSAFFSSSFTVPSAPLAYIAH